MPGESSPTLYDALQVPRNASAEDIRAAYRRLAREHHPDRAGADGQAMARVNQAYEILSDPDRRASYDRRLDTRPPPRKPGRVVLPGQRRRTRMLWALAGIAAAVVAGLAVMVGLRARETTEVADSPPSVMPLSLPLPDRDSTAARPVGDEGLRLIPSRSIRSVPPGDGKPDTTARSR